MCTRVLLEVGMRHTYSAFSLFLLLVVGFLLLEWLRFGLKEVVSLLVGMGWW